MLLTKFLAITALAVGSFAFQYPAGAQPCDGELITSNAAPPPTAAAIDIHQKQLATVTTADVDLVVIGDSLAGAFDRSAVRPMSLFNLGVDGDKTQNVLWRLSFPDWSKIRPHNALIILGTNNLSSGDSPCAIVAGLKKVFARVAAIWPSTRIVFLEIPPRGDRFLQFNDRRVEVNTAIRQLPGITSINVDDDLTCASQIEGSKPCKNYSSDNLHFLSAGYRVIGSALKRATSAR